MNKKSIAFNEEEYKLVINTIRTGFKQGKVTTFPNNRVATICIVQACLGLRLGDVLQLKMSSFINEAGRYHLSIVEQKTGKHREFTVPNEVYSFIQTYAYERGINKDARLFPISARQVQLHLNKVFKYLGMDVRKYGSHSFRKYFATGVYNDNAHDIELVRVLLQHSSVTTTQKYIGISQDRIEDAISKTVCSLV